MSYDIHFLKKNVVVVTAAIIGISDKRWEAYRRAHADEVKAQKIMRKRRFDILPIVSDSGVTEYFQTDRWNDFSTISKKQIASRDTIHFQIPLRDLIYEFASRSRLFFFLKDESKVVGLVSIVHLNSRQVKVFLYNLLSDLEICLSQFLSSNIKERELLEIKLETTNKKGKVDKIYEKAKKQYKKDVTNGLESSFVEYLNLSHLIKITINKNLYKNIGYSSEPEFASELWPLNGLRNIVAHPVRSLITDINTVSKLWEQITRIDTICDQIRNLGRRLRQLSKKGMEELDGEEIYCSALGTHFIENI